MHTKSKDKSWYIIEASYIIIPAIFIFILEMLFFRYNSSLKLIGDEFGYWSAGAWMVGIDWSDMASINNYYGYGYGIILAPLLLLPINAITRYKLAILINYMMVIGVYCIIYYLLNKMQIFQHKYLSSAVALVVTIYTGNIYHTQYTMSETIVLLGFWSFILLLYSMTKKKSLYKAIIGIVLLAYLYSVHQRMISIVFAGAISIFLLYFERKNYKKLIFLVVCLLLMLLCVESIKRIYQESYLANEFYSLLYFNDYSGQVSRVSALLSFAGIKRLIISIMGKIFYILSSSYLLAGITIIDIFKRIYNFVKIKKLFKEGIILIFISALIMCAITISAIFLAGYEARYDALIYGRYNEFFVSFLILYGLITICKNSKVSYKMYAAVIVIYILLTVIMSKELPVGVVDCSFMNSSGLYDSLRMFDYNIWWLGIKAVSIFLLIVVCSFLIKKKQQHGLILIMCVFLGANWIFSYFYVCEEGLFSWAVPGCQAEEELADYVVDIGAEDNLYYYVGEGQHAFYLQYLLDDIEIQCVYGEEGVEQLPKDSYLITENPTKFYYTDIATEYIRIDQPASVILWEENAVIGDEGEKFTGNDSVKFIAGEYANYFEIEMQVYLECYPGEGESAHLVRKFKNWKDEMSFLIGIDNGSFIATFSQDGKNIDGIWLEQNILKIGEWQTLRVTFFNGYIKIYVNEILKGERQLGLNDIYMSEHMLEVGNGLHGQVRRFCIKPIDTGITYPSFIAGDAYVISDSGLIDDGNGIQFNGDDSIRFVCQENYVDNFEIGMQIYLDEYPQSDAYGHFIQKSTGWQDNLSYLIGIDRGSFVVVFSGDGENIEGIWLEQSKLKLGQWQDLVVKFQNGTGCIYINGELVGEKQFTFDKIYYSELPNEVGTGLNVRIRNCYIKDI